MYYVYVHTNKTNNKKYVGITNDTSKRWRNNGIAYKPYKGNTNGRPFWNAICKYGFDMFEHELIKEVENFEQACEAEKYYIIEYQTTNSKYGYNLSAGGNGGKVYKEHPKGMKGKHHGDEKKAKQSVLMKELQDNGKMVWKNGHPKGMSGKKHTEEYKKHISKVMKGRVFSEETKIKMGNSQRGKVVSEETKTKIKEGNLGKQKGGENPFSKKVMYSINGKTKKFECVNELLADLDITKQLFYKIVKSSEPYIPSGVWKYKKQHLSGLTIVYLE